MVPNPLFNFFSASFIVIMSNYYFHLNYLICHFHFSVDINFVYTIYCFYITHKIENIYNSSGWYKSSQKSFQSIVNFTYNCACSIRCIAAYIIPHFVDIAARFHHGTETISQEKFRLGIVNKGRKSGNR